MNREGNLISGSLRLVLVLYITFVANDDPSSELLNARFISNLWIESWPKLTLKSHEPGPYDGLLKLRFYIKQRIVRYSIGLMPARQAC